jgi:hypothetical protein
VFPARVVAYQIHPKNDATDHDRYLPKELWHDEPELLCRPSVSFRSMMLASSSS